MNIVNINIIIFNYVNKYKLETLVMAGDFNG